MAENWVLLRGLMREARHWGDFPQLLAQQLAEDGKAINVLTPDFAGNGSLHQQASSASVAGMVAQLRADLEQQGHAPPYNVLALSLGAMAALAWAQQYPDEVARLVLINTSLQPYNRFYQRLRPQNYPRLLRMLLAGDALQREQTVLALTSNLTATEKRDILARTWRGYGEECPISRRNILRQLLAAMRFRAGAAVPHTELLMLASEQDNLVSVHCSRAIARRWNCDLQLHASAGHDLPLDDAPWVLAQLRRWLAANDGKNA